MQKKGLLIALSILTCIYYATGQEAAYYWRESIVPQYSDSNLSSFSVHCTLWASNPESFLTDLHIEKYQDGIYLTQSVDNVDFNHLVIKRDTVILIENGYANITYDGGSDNKVCNYIKDVYSLNLFKYMPLLEPTNTIFHVLRDTIIGNTDYYILNGTFLAGWYFNEETKKYDIPNYEYLRYWCNKGTNRVEKIVVSKDSTTMLADRIYEMTYNETSPQRHYPPDKYNIHSSLYSDYTIYDVTLGDPAPSVIGHYSYNTEMTDEVLNFPLVSPNYDTLTLGDTIGWKMLEFWSYGCKPCVEFLQTLEKEKDSLGYRVLEQNDISIFCIENKGGVTDRFKSYAKKWKAEDILYAARGMEFLNVRYTPYYYLYSPDNSLIYHGTTKNITDTLLHAKSMYEKQKNTIKKTNGPYISVDKTEHDYGEVSEGCNSVCIFWIENKGNKPLVIDHVSSSCGCTTTEYPRNPIAPGKKDKVTIKYNTSIVGRFQKTVVIVSNATNTPRMVLKIKGNVITDPCHK